MRTLRIPCPLLIISLWPFGNHLYLSNTPHVFQIEKASLHAQLFYMCDLLRPHSVTTVISPIVHLSSSAEKWRHSILRGGLGILTPTAGLCPPNLSQHSTEGLQPCAGMNAVIFTRTHHASKALPATVGFLSPRNPGSQHFHFPLYLCWQLFFRLSCFAASGPYPPPKDWP